MDRLQITAHLANGVISMDPWGPMLDAILGYQVLREQMGERFYLSDPHRDGLIEPELPLERRGDGDDWYWACSAAVYGEHMEYLKHFHKRFDDQHLRYLDTGKAKTVNVKSGRYKAWRTPHTCRLAGAVRWYAVGDRAEIGRLLARVTHLGKRAAHGMGMVLRWDVEPVDVDGSETLDGRVTRPLPLGMFSTASWPEDAEIYTGEATIRPPYWWPGHVRHCVLPGSEAPA